MKFIMMVKGDEAYEAGTPPDPKLMQTIGEMGAEAVRAGKMVLQAGLQPSRAGWRMGLAKGKAFAVDGPFAETKEVIGGLAILDCESREEALRLAQAFVDAHAQCGVSELAMEVRPLYEHGEMGCPEAA